MIFVHRGGSERSERIALYIAPEGMRERISRHSSIPPLRAGKVLIRANHLTHEAEE